MTAAGQKPTTGKSTKAPFQLGVIPVTFASSVDPAYAIAPGAELEITVNLQPGAAYPSNCELYAYILPPPPDELRAKRALTVANHDIKKPKVKADRKSTEKVKLKKIDLNTAKDSLLVVVARGYSLEGAPRTYTKTWMIR